MNWTTDEWGNIVSVTKNAYEVIEHDLGPRFNTQLVWAYSIDEVIAAYPGAAVQSIALDDLFE